MWWLGRAFHCNFLIFGLEREKTLVLVLLTHYKLTNYFLCVDKAGTKAVRATKKRKKKLTK